MGPFVNQNWVANFILFGPPTFPLVTLVLHHQLGQSSRFSLCISLFNFLGLCILDLFSIFFSFLFLNFLGSKVDNNMIVHVSENDDINIDYKFQDLVCYVDTSLEGLSFS